MLDKKSQQRDLKYSFYVALIVFLAAIRFWWGTTELLSFWLGLVVAVPAFMITYVVLRLVRLIGGVTGLNKPYNNAKDSLRGKVDEIVEEIDEEMEKERESRS